jgi:hypothetical protein
MRPGFVVEFLVVENKITSPFTPPDQQKNPDYYQFDVFFGCVTGSSLRTMT